MDIEELVLAAQAGDQDARDQIAEWMFDMLGEFLAGLGFPYDQVADLRQQTYVVVFENLDNFTDQGSGSFGRWTREIAHRRANERWRIRVREAANLHKLALYPHPSTLSLTSKLTMIELQQLLSGCDGVVTDNEREAMMWEFETQWDDHELARRRGVAVQTIRTRRHRGYQRLADYMRDAPRPPQLWLVREESSSSLSR